MRRWPILVAWAGALLATSLALAAEPAGKPFDISTPGSFQSQAAEVRTGLAPRGAYAFLSSRQRMQVEQHITEMATLFNQFGTIQAMDGAQRVALYNAQAASNWILTRGRYGSIRCAWNPTTGSHIPRTQCWSIQPGLARQ